MRMGRMKMGSIMRRTGNVLCVILLGVGCTGCGSKNMHETSTVKVPVQEQEQQQTDSNEFYTAYDGYAFCEEDGQVKYMLATKNGFELHCFFQSGSPEYEEVIYHLQISEQNSLDEENNAIGYVEVTQITDDQGLDLTQSFSIFTFSFYSNQVLMKVERKENMLAGGNSDNLQTGEYILTSTDNMTNRQTSPDNTDSETETTEKLTDSVMVPYEESELIAVSRAYYEQQSGFLAPQVECEDNGDGTTTLHLYETVQDDDETWHTATSAWYTVDSYGKGKDIIMENEVQFPMLSLKEIASYMLTPVKLQYIVNGEAHNEWEITDETTIAACINALKEVTIGEKTESRVSDAGETLQFELPDGSVWTLVFENGNLIRNEICYETEGYNNIRNLLKDYLAEEGLW